MMCSSRRVCTSTERNIDTYVRCGSNEVQDSSRMGTYADTVDAPKKRPAAARASILMNADIGWDSRWWYEDSRESRKPVPL